LIHFQSANTCELGIVLALDIEWGGLADLLRGASTIRGEGFVVRQGRIGDRATAMILSGPGRDLAAMAAERLIEGHRPQRIVSAGFAGGLCADLKRLDILVADRVMIESGDSIPIDLPAGLASAIDRSDVHRGPLLTVDEVVRQPDQRETLYKNFGAMAVDMETFAVAEVCRRRGAAFSSVRAINDARGDTLPRDIQRLLRQKTPAARWGAALGSVWRRPAVVKDLYLLRKNALAAADRLAQFIADARFD